MSGSGKKKILFVDDEPRILAGLRRMLSSLRQDWDMVFVQSGAQALEEMERSSFDVIVSDLRMPKMNGAELLESAKRLSPSTVRIALSGYAEQEIAARAVGTAHQYLAKPCNPETLKGALDRACTLRALLAEESLIKLVAGLHALPSIPSVYSELVAKTQCPGVTPEAIAAVIERDIAMVAKILQVVNSDFFGLRRTVNDIGTAVRSIGVETTKLLVLSTGVFIQCADVQALGLSLDKISEWSHRVARCAEALARADRFRATVIEQTYAAGLLHDIGVVVLAASFPEKYREVLKEAGENRGILEAEHHILSASHPEVGAYLLGLWGLCDPIVEAALFHHSPWVCVAREAIPVALVHAAGAFVAERWGEPFPGAAPILNGAALDQIASAERMSTWRKACLSLP